MRRGPVVRALVLVATLSTLALAVPYEFVDLHPGGSFAASVASRSQAGVVVGYVGDEIYSPNLHAALWTSPSSASFVDINPGGYEVSQAWSISGDLVVGMAAAEPTWAGQHAIVWELPSAASLDLNPTGYLYSEALDVCNGKIVGSGRNQTTNKNVALLWAQSPPNPGYEEQDLGTLAVGYRNTRAYGISGNNLVGEGYTDTFPSYIHALFWQQNPVNQQYTVHNLHPDPHPTLGWDYYVDTGAYYLSGNEVVGWGLTEPFFFGGRYEHALLWPNAPGNAYVDLHPTGYEESCAWGARDGKQVGYGTGTSLQGIDFEHALLWEGSAANVVDLHDYVPAGYDYSQAYDIDALGNIVGVAYHNGDGQYHACMWRVPGAEPWSLEGATADIVYDPEGFANLGLPTTGMPPGIVPMHAAWTVENFSLDPGPEYGTLRLYYDKVEADSLGLPVQTLDLYWWSALDARWYQGGTTPIGLPGPGVFAGINTNPANFGLGYYGLDTEHCFMWAHINHASVYVIGGAIPEPGTLALLGAGLLALAQRRRKR